MIQVKKFKKKKLQYSYVIGRFSPMGGSKFQHFCTMLSLEQEFSLYQANKAVKKFILESFEDKYKKLLVITGKGLRSKVHDNPYLSEQMNILKNSVPEFIKNDESLHKKIKKISEADLKDGGKGAFYIFLK